MNMPEINRKQGLRNALSDIEDEARALRNDNRHGELEQVYALLTRLTQIIREEVVR